MLHRLGDPRFHFCDFVNQLLHITYPKVKVYSDFIGTKQKLKTLNFPPINNKLKLEL